MGGKGSGGNSKPCQEGCQCRRHKRGSERYNWTGDDASYVAKHIRLHRKVGSASQFICECGKPAKHWAQTHGSSGLSIKDFRPLCVKCHRIYDRDSIKGERNPMARLTGSTVEQIRSAYATGKYTQKALAGQYGVSQAHISRIVREEKWN